MSEDKSSFIDELILGMKQHYGALEEEAIRNEDAQAQLIGRRSEIRTEIDALSEAIAALEKARPAENVLGTVSSERPDSWSTDIDPGIREKPRRYESGRPVH